MADGDSNTSSDGGDNKEGKRRYFRRRKPTEGSGSASERSTTDGPERKANEGRTEGRSGSRSENRSGGGKAGESRGASPQGKAGARRRTRRPRSGSNPGSSAPSNAGNGPSGTDSAPSNAGGNANKPRTGESNETGASRRARRSNRPERAGRPERGERPDSNRRSSRSRRKRRSSGQEAPVAVPMVTESTIDAIAHEYEAPKAVFVYTHVSRPSYQGMPDYRTEHFPRTGRTLADFHVDISPLFDEEGNMLPPGTFRRADEGLKEDTFTEGDWEEAEE